MSYDSRFEYLFDNHKLSNQAPLDLVPILYLIDRAKSTTSEKISAMKILRGLSQCLEIKVANCPKVPTNELHESCIHNIETSTQIDLYNDIVHK
jgi:hypothetical protein